ncbi:hypothetical protein Aperf_G00000055635 [Anoplocephala perfoliata]
MALAKPPETLKRFSRICKMAQDCLETDPVITYYCRLYVASMGLKSDSKVKESRDFISKLLDYLDEAKKANATDPMYTEEKVGLQYIESQAVEMFTTAFKRDESGDFSNATLAGFLNAANLLEVLTLNGETNEELTNARKYAKFKVVHIVDCRKRGVQPVAGPLQEGDASEAPNLAGLHDETSLPREPEHKPAPEVHKPEPTGSTPTGGHEAHGLPPEAYDKAAKAAKFAIGCLQYKDKDGAVKYLHEALNHLKTHQ